MRVSVIIPVENYNDNLKACLKALKKQKFRDFEVIVVSERFKGSPSAKRNWGARKAAGAILAFLDDDCVAEENWIEKGVKILEDREDKGDDGNIIGAVGGVMLTPPNSPFWERVSGYLAESPVVNPINLKKNRMFVEDWPSANFFIRKKDFLRLGGFDSRFWPGEDTKLCLDIVESGKKILYDPEVIVCHRRRPLFKKYLEQVARYGRQRGRFARMFPQTSRRWYYFIPSVFVIYLILAIFNHKIALAISIYIIIVGMEGVRVAIKDRNLLMVPVFMMGVFLTHVVYGVNFIRGLIEK